MYQYRLTRRAQQDVVNVLAWTFENFGARARVRYKALIDRAIHDIANDPFRPGSESLSDPDSDGRFYHLKNCRMPKRTGRVHKPRHMLVYRLGNDGCVEIGRILHDSMDLKRHLPDDDEADSDQ